MEKKQIQPQICFAIILGFLIASTVVLQIATCNAGTTKLETTLFSILQFLFSIAFAWVLSSIILKEEYMNNQKKFSLAAYRRIKEIDKGVERLIERIRHKKETMPKEVSHELEVVLEVATGIQETIKSSTADWTDIIGEEVSTVEKIENIKEEQNRLLQEESFSTDKIQPVLVQLKKKEDELTKLISSLPYELQIITKESKYIRDDVVSTAIDILKKEKKQKGFIEIYCFWDPSFERKISDFSIGDRLIGYVGEMGTRGLGTVLVKDTSDKAVGVVTNKMSETVHYDEFRHALTRAVKKYEFQVEITDIEKEISAGDRQYFYGKIVD